MTLPHALTLFSYSCLFWCSDEDEDHDRVTVRTDDELTAMMVFVRAILISDKSILLKWCSCSRFHSSAWYDIMFTTLTCLLHSSSLAGVVRILYLCCTYAIPCQHAWCKRICWMWCIGSTSVTTPYWELHCVVACVVAYLYSISGNVESWISSTTCRYFHGILWKPVSQHYSRSRMSVVQMGRGWYISENSSWQKVSVIITRSQ